MKKLIILVLLLENMALSQAPIGLRHIQSKNYSIDFYVNTEEKKVKHKDTLDYYWFKSQAIHITQGSSSGYRLNGDYVKYYLSGQIAEQGNFKNGLKHNVWRTWYENGNVESIYVFKQGILEGDFKRYDNAGKLIEEGVYKKGQVHTKKKKKEKKIKTQEESPEEKALEKEERKRQKKERSKAKKEKSDQHK